MMQQRLQSAASHLIPDTNGFIVTNEDLNIVAVSQKYGSTMTGCM